jgi:4-hydroxybenzoyl-CoA thioesterase
MTGPFVLPVRFADCDPAGIAYYPRLLALLDAAIEDWTGAVLGVDRRALHLERRLGLPTVSLDADFPAPARLGDRLAFTVRVDRLGISSVTLAVEGRIGELPVIEARLVQVLTDLETLQSRAWPEAWRRALAPQPEELSR